MEPNADQPKAPESKPGSETNAKDDLKSLPCRNIEEGAVDHSLCTATLLRPGGGQSELKRESLGGRKRVCLF